MWIAVSSVMMPLQRAQPRPRTGSIMMHLRKTLGLACLAIGFLATSPSILLAQDEVQNALDAFWAEVSRTVGEGDFDGYAATYHEDAVLVSGTSGTSYPIAQALDGWEQGFLATQAGEVKASVEFRFTQRLHDGTTAHETGIFKYAVEDPDGEPMAQFVHFEALLVDKAGWKMVMEYQKAPATEAEWEAAKE